MKPVTVSLLLNGVLLTNLFLIPKPASSSLSEGQSSHYVMVQPAPSLFAPASSDMPKLETETGKEGVVETISQGWVYVPRDDLRNSIGIFGPGPFGISEGFPFRLSEDMRDALGISEWEHESFQKFSEQLFESVLEAEAEKTEAVEEKGGIGFFRIPSLRQEVAQFRSGWVNEMKNLWPPEIVDIVDQGAQSMLDEAELEKNISIKEGRGGYGFLVEIIEAREGMMGGFGQPFDLTSGEGGGQGMLKRYLHIPAVSEVVLPFLRDQGIPFDPTGNDQ